LTSSTGPTVAAGAYDDWGNPQPNPGQHQTGGLLTGVINLPASSDEGVDVGLFVGVELVE
jgi:hypothetical protein